MERKLAVTAACNLASQCVGRPVKFGQHSWQVFYNEPDETAPHTMQTDSYAKALAMTLETKALIAIQLLGESWGYQWDNGPHIEVYLKSRRAGTGERPLLSRINRQSCSSVIGTP